MKSVLQGVMGGCSAPKRSWWLPWTRVTFSGRLGSGGTVATSSIVGIRWDEAVALLLVHESLTITWQSIHAGPDRSRFINIVPH